MEFMLKEMENMLLLVDKLNELDKLLATDLTIEEREELENQKQLISFDIEESCLKQRLRNEGLNDEIIRDFASLASKRSLFSNKKLEKENKTEENEYDLSSPYILSKKNGETINAKYMRTREKIRTIYEHTGEIVSYQDPILIKERDNSYKSVASFLINIIGEKNLKAKYGVNWEKEFEKLYKSLYDECTKNSIDRITKDVDEKNKNNNNDNQERKQTDSDEKKKLTEELKSAEEKAGELSKENDTLKKELDDAHLKIEELVQQISKVQKNNKDNLEEYRDALVNAVQKNSKDSNVFEYTPEEKTKILGALGIQFEYDETKNHGIGIDNDYKLLVMGGIPIEQTARQMMICKNLGIRVSVNFNENELSNASFENEQQVVDAYLSNNNQHKSI